MAKPTLVDLACGAGLGADGYTAAGFKVRGLDKYDQPHYPYPFLKGDLLDALRSEWLLDAQVVHVSAPCQLFTRAKHLRDAQGAKSKETLDLLTPSIERLRKYWGHTAWVVENVEGARSIMQPREGESLVTMCGSAFDLGVRRHRLFLSNRPLDGLPCRHKEQGRPWGVYHVPGDSIPQGGRTARDAAHGCEVMGVDRPVPWQSLKEGFPPAYTQHIGAQLAAMC